MRGIIVKIKFLIMYILLQTIISIYIVYHKNEWSKDKVGVFKRTAIQMTQNEVYICNRITE